MVSVAGIRLLLMPNSISLIRWVLCATGTVKQSASCELNI